MKYKSIMCLNELVFNGKHYQNGLICCKTNGLMVQNFNDFMCVYIYIYI